MSEVKPVPEGFSTITPYLIVRDAEHAIEFYKKAFNAKENYRNYTPDGKDIIHADLEIGNSKLLLSEEFPAMKCLSPMSIGGSSVVLHLYVDNADVIFEQAISAGATVSMPLADTYWGDRYGKLIDPFGHTWSVATHKQDLSQEQIQSTGEKVFSEMSKKI